MQLKNNENRNHQFFFYKKVEGRKEPVLDYVHVPGGATVELEDEVFEAICKTKTTVSVIEEITVPLDEATVGANLKNGKDVLTMKEYNDTGKKKTVSLVRKLISSGKLTVVERPAVPMDVINKVLNDNGISIKDMSDEQKQALYDKLA